MPARVALVVLLLATASACTASSDAGSVHNSGADGNVKAGAATRTAQPNARAVDAEAVEVMGTGEMLVAGRLPHGQRTQVWRCSALTDISGPSTPHRHTVSPQAPGAPCRSLVSDRHC